eukprot:NODE_22_length_38364_cov_0.248661.p10 type:complete len:405 gc:universal NODE_22_length_38364_cov_0.248661:29864-28650(-)
MFRLGSTAIRFNIKPAVNPTIWQRVKHEANHFWTGSKLLVAETKISSRLLRQTLSGQPLTHREHRQLKRTTSDLLRIVPFSVFLIVPFMEFLLPVVIKIFPNFLPSTFRDEFKEQENRKKLLGVRLKVASFLRETLEEKDKGELGTFVNLLNNMQPKSQQDESAIVATPDLLKLCQKFKDNVTLDHLSRQQLISICRYFTIPGIGTNDMIRRNVARHINKIRLEDGLILQDAIRIDQPASTPSSDVPESPASLMPVISDIPIHELQTLCKERGIPVSSPRRMRLELKQWVELSGVYNVPNILLVLSRILMVDMQFKDSNKTVEQSINASGLSEETLNVLKDTLKSLPDTVIKETMLDMARGRGEKDVILAAVQEEMVEIEKEKEARQQDELKKQVEKESAAQVI